MPELIPSKRFLKDIEKFRANPNIHKKVAKTLVYLENDPLHPGLHPERIVNDPTAWSVGVDRKCRISIDPKKHLASGNPDWSASVTLLRILVHDDLYKFPR